MARHRKKILRHRMFSIQAPPFLTLAAPDPSVWNRHDPTLQFLRHRTMKPKIMNYSLLLSLATLLLTACGPVQDTAPGQPVAHRQQAFKEILRRFEPMGIALREDRYEPEWFLQQATALHQHKDAPWPYFGPETNYPPSRSKESVWTNTEGFARERETFLAAIESLQQAARTKEKQKVKPAYQAVQDSCRSCHKAFKAQ